MKIAYFSSKYPYDNNRSNYIYGGSVLATYYLVNEIIKLGHQVKVFTSSYNSRDDIEKYYNFDIYRYGSQINILSSNLSLGLFHKPFEYDNEVIHQSFDMPPGPFAGLRYAKKKNIPLIITYHGDWEERYGNMFRRFGVKFCNKLITEKILSYATFIISPSKLYAESSKFLSDYKEKTKVIPNGINLDEFETSYSKEECRDIINLPNDKNILIYFGYLSPYKSPDVLLKSFVKILEHEPDTLLLYAGNGEMMDNLKSLSKNLKIEKNVKFAGFIEKDKRIYYYKSSDIFCLPSSMSTECYPLAILEAMASNVPVVASEIGGIPDIIQNNVNGLLVPPKNQEKLEETLIYLLKNSKVRDRLSKNALKGIKKYSWENIAKQTNELYNELGEKLWE